MQGEKMPQGETSLTEGALGKPTPPGEIARWGGGIARRMVDPEQARRIRVECYHAACRAAATDGNGNVIPTVDELIVEARKISAFVEEV